VKVAILSGSIVVCFNFVTFKMEVLDNAWYIMSTIACYMVIVFINAIGELIAGMETSMETKIHNNTYILLLFPVLGTMSTAKVCQDMIHGVFIIASRDKTTNPLLIQESPSVLVNK
jgi:hypothetical protein